MKLIPIFLLMFFLACAQRPISAQAEIPPFEKSYTVLESRAVELEKGMFFAGWQEDSKNSYSEEANWMTPYQNQRRCAFGFKSDKNETLPLFTRQHSSYSWSGNPIVFKAGDGALVAVCMSAMAPFLGSGILEMKYSNDKGQTWTDWTPLYSNDKGSPDKPTIYSLNKSSVAIAFVDFNVTSYERQEFFGKNYNVNQLQGQLKQVKVSWNKKGRLQIGTPEIIDVTGFTGTSVGSISGHYTTEFLSQTAPWGILSGPNKQDPLLLIHPLGHKWKTQKLFVTGIEGPICRLAEHKKQRAILCYHAHRAANVILAHSADGGRNWSPPVRISSNGGLGALAFNSHGVLTAIWSQVPAPGEIEVLRQAWTPLLKPQGEAETLVKYRAETLQEIFFGAYQDLLWSAADKKFYAFLAGAGAVDLPILKRLPLD